MKKKEWHYNYWQNEFDGHNGYMVSDKGGEPYFVRKIIFRYVKNNESLLDVGCASGGSYYHIKNYTHKNIRYKGVDFCERFIESNKNRFPEIDWSVQDARELQEKDKSYDVVLLYDVLDNMPEWEKAVDEAIRVANKKIIVTMWSDPSMDEKKKYFDRKKMPIKQFCSQKNMNYHYFLIVEKT